MRAAQPIEQCIKVALLARFHHFAASLEISGKSDSSENASTNLACKQVSAYITLVTEVAFGHVYYSNKKSNSGEDGKFYTVHIQP